MNMPVMKLSPQIVALRIRENKFDALQRDLDDLVLDWGYQIDIPRILGCLQASLTKRQGLIPEDTLEHINIQQDVNVLEALINGMTIHHETDGLILRAGKLEDLKIAVSKVGLTG
ncbi:hypothetical protein [Nitrosomonas sp.]|uniref:hypothetical protein n=1 Tax=Nitrosomonas sp. TaxID=42353 RepID=UPI0025E75218|nr:hypothetical protein [Nitrosomonas sp.]MBV6447252.1 hypothetical protein [Nitrosomonas sp.]